MPFQQRKKTWGPLAFYCLAALGLSACLLPFQYFIGHDGVWYARMAEHIMAGKGLSVNPGEPYTGHPPFYSILMATVNLLLRDIQLSGHLVSMLAFSLTLIPLSLLAQSIYPPPTAHWVSLLYVTNGFLLLHSNLVMTETLFLLLVMIQTYLTHSLIQKERLRAPQGMLLGLVAGTSFLTRPEGLLFYAASVLGLLVLSYDSLGQRIRIVLLSLALFLVVTLPYVQFVSHHTGKLEFTSDTTKVFILRQLDVAHPGQWLEVKKLFWGFTEDRTRIKADELEEEFRLFDYLKKDDFALVRSLGPSAVVRLLDLNKYLFGGLGFFLIGASFFPSPWGSSRKRSELLLLITLSTFLPQLMGYFLPKRYLLIFPLLILWMGHGIEVFRNWAKQSWGLKEKGSFLAPLGLCLLLALASAGYVWRTLTHTPVPLEPQAMGLWMKENIPDIGSQGVAARHPAVNFYSGAKFLWLPYVDHLEDLRTYLKQNRAKYVVVSEDLDSPFLETYQPLLQDRGSPPVGFVLKQVVRNGKKYFLYEV